MTRHLILMRHAKSDWGSPGLPDHARPLNARGAGDAPVLGDWLRQNSYLPDEVLCSTATRTRETLQGLGLTAKIPTQFVASLYHADPDTMFETLQKAAGQSVLMLGHNPGIARFAADLVRHAPDHPRFDDYPTCATLVVRFDIAAWGTLQNGSGHCVDFAIPADLK